MSIIWVPKWLYKVLPYISFLVGGLGIVMSDTVNTVNTILLTVSVVLCIYGLGIHLVRDMYREFEL